MSEISDSLREGCREALVYFEGKWAEVHHHPASRYAERVKYYRGILAMPTDGPREHKFSLSYVGKDGKDKPATGAWVQAFNNPQGKGSASFEGYIDEEGFARDLGGRHPLLNPGTYFFFPSNAKRGYEFQMSAVHVMIGEDDD